MGLRLKFVLILAASLLVGLAASAVLFYQVSLDNAKKQVHAQIAVLRAQALAVRKYTTDEVRPLLAPLSDVQFLPQTVPSFSAQTVFAAFRERYPAFYYKEAALNPTNPNDLATSWERELIERLRANSSITEIAEVRQTPQGRQYTVAYPLTVSNQDCLACHSTPDKAPASMVALYGKENGFNWKLGETIGAQIFSVPLALVEGQVWNSMVWMLGIASAVFAALLALLNILLGRMVIAPVTRMARIAEAVSMGDSSLPEYQHAAKDEIGSLATSFNRMRRSLDSAMKMLDN